MSPESSHKTNADGKHESDRPDICSGSVACLAEHYRELLDVQDEIAASAAVAAPGVTQEEVRDRLAAGVPLLSFDDFFPAWAQAQPAFQRVIKWATTGAADHPMDEPEWASVDVGETLFRELALVWYSGDGSHSLDGLQARVELVATVGACLKPFLQARSKLLMPMVEQAIWRRRHCPVCGGKPDLGYLDREQGARWLVCSRCDGEWLFQRLECPYCGTQDQTKLAYLTDDAEQHRLYVCDACHRYIKVIDLRGVHSNVRLPLQRFLTLDMDLQAKMGSYLPGC